MEKKSIIWVKTPRTAGTALKRFLLQHRKMFEYDPKILMDLKVVNNSVSRPVICVIASDLHWFIDNNESLWENSYKFTVVRNPFDKFISAWSHLYQGDKVEQQKTLRQTIDNLPLWDEAAFHISYTQTSIIAGPYGYIDYDKIIRYENLQEELDEIFEMIGLKGEQLPVVNSIYHNREHNDYRGYYEDNEYVYRKVKRLFWVDLKLFGYQY